MNKNCTVCNIVKPIEDFHSEEIIVCKTCLVSLIKIKESSLGGKDKICTTCKESLPLEEFYVEKKTKDGRRAVCKNCMNDFSKNRYKNMKPEEKDKLSKYSRTKNKEWFQKNKKRVCENIKERNRTDPNFSLIRRIRGRHRSALVRYLKTKNCKKVDKTLNLLGCSAHDFKTYIESLFRDGMAWDKLLNSEVHLDHIRPCSSFDLSKPEDQRACFHYTNIQPLWAVDNLKKGDKMPPILGNQNKN